MLDCRGVKVLVGDTIVYTDINDLGHPCLTVAIVAVVNTVGIRVDGVNSSINITESPDFAVVRKVNE